MQARHILPLTGIRFFAASWVVLYHFHPWLIMLCPFLVLLDPLLKLGYEAVPLFFLLSGFILSHNYFPSYSPGQHPRFVFLRFARLWPVHVVTLALVVLGPGLLQLQGAQLKLLLEELSMVRSWFHDDPAWNAPAWSISAEWFAYIFVFPLAYLLYRRIRWWPGLAFIVTAFLCIQVSPLNEMLFPGPTRCGAIVFLFLAGSGLYRIRCLLEKPPVSALIITGIICFLAYVLFSRRLSVLILYFAFALLILGLSYERGLLARVLSTKLVVQGGLASYSLYMTHYLVIQSFIYYSWDSWKQLPQMAVVRTALLLMIAGIFLGTALLFYRCIEEPANRKLRRLFDKDVFAGGKLKPA